MTEHECKRPYFEDLVESYRCPDCGSFWSRGPNGRWVRVIEPTYVPKRDERWEVVRTPHGIRSTMRRRHGSD